MYAAPKYKPRDTENIVVYNIIIEYFSIRVLLFSYPGNLLKRIKTLSHCVSLSFKTIVFVFQNTFGTFKLSQNAKNLQCLLKFELIEDNVTVFQ